jgi:cytochrome c556
MRRFGMSIFAVTVVALGINLLAVNEKPNDAMKAVMNGNAAANASARAAAKAMDYPTLVKEAGNYRANLAYIDAYFTHKKLDAAATIAKTGLKAAMDLETAAAAKNQAGVDAALTAVTGTCGACHKQFREQLPDKSYEIKLP